jgi:hypothetical protein
MKKFVTNIAKKTSAVVATFALAAQSNMVVAVDAIKQEIKPGTGYATDLGSIINFVLRIVMIIAVLLVFFYLVLGGIEWITSGGEKGKTEAARNKITSAVVGLIILAASYAILTLLLSYLGFGGSLTNAINDVPAIK